MLQNTTFAQNTTFGHGNSTAGNSDDASNQVSWQSAFWPIIACTFAVILQDSGKVNSLHQDNSYALKSSFIICFLDTSLMIVELVCLMCVGCSFRVAARHVWYNRFDGEEAPSDNAWIFFFKAIRGEKRDDYYSISIASETPAHLTSRTLTGLDHHHGSSRVGTTNLGYHQHPTVAWQGCAAGRPEPSTLTMMNNHDHNGTFTASGSVASIREHYTVVPLESIIVPTIVTQPPTPGSLNVNVLGWNGINKGKPTASPMISERLPYAKFEAFMEHDSQETGPSGEIHGSSEELEITEYDNQETAPSSEACHPFEEVAEPAIDHTWRIGTIAFILGALPQAIKIFGMRSIPFTQFSVAVFFVTFLVAEVFRFIAGPAGAIDLQPLPVVKNIKEEIRELKDILSVILSGLMLYLGMGYIPMSYTGQVWHGPVVLFLFATGVAAIAACTFLLLDGAAGSGRVMTFMRRLDLLGKFVDAWSRLLGTFTMLISDLTAIDQNLVEVYLVPGGVFFVFFIITLAVPSCLRFSPTVFTLVSFWDPVVTYVAFFTTAPAWMSLCHIIFRLFFMGSLSYYPRKVLGLKGTVAECWRGCFVLANLSIWFLIYSALYNPEGTYKPSWADALG
ncbi:hypothetical protein CC86DRAFT_386431 [Ophiobolus disseminans]|uniref:Uncharacterized protein n=1 Tax=Ophiobolus disseminans TaxID=1469910 RepID=A0A6A6ZKA5_9PLEO|nr:hypothetical protein CC86DRAFT_386431 [Ophiobolus disseminans]